MSLLVDEQYNEAREALLEIAPEEFSAIPFEISAGNVWDIENPEKSRVLQRIENVISTALQGAAKHNKRNIVTVITRALELKDHDFAEGNYYSWRRERNVYILGKMAETAEMTGVKVPRVVKKYIEGTNHSGPERR